MLDPVGYMPGPGTAAERRSRSFGLSGSMARGSFPNEGPRRLSSSLFFEKKPLPFLYIAGPGLSMPKKACSKPFSTTTCAREELPKGTLFELPLVDITCRPSAEVALYAPGAGSVRLFFARFFSWLKREDVPKPNEACVFDSDDAWRPTEEVAT